jgi:hypothetical protein
VEASWPRSNSLNARVHHSPFNGDISASSSEACLGQRRRSALLATPGTLVHKHSDQTTAARAVRQIPHTCAPNRATVFRDSVIELFGNSETKGQSIVGLNFLGQSGAPYDGPAFRAGAVRALTWPSRCGACAWRVSLSGVAALLACGKEEEEEYKRSPRFFRIVGCINECKP